MGKSKHKEEKEMSVDSLPTILYSDSDRASLSSNSTDDDIDETELPVKKFNPEMDDMEPSPKKSRKSFGIEPEPTNVDDEYSGVDSSNAEIILIRKPIEVSIGDLKNLKLIKLASKNKNFTTGDGTFDVSLTDCKEMVHISCPTFTTAKDVFNIKPSGTISQHINIKRVQDIPEEETNIRIKSIRKKPSLKMGHLQQRLKAYGVRRKKIEKQ